MIGTSQRILVVDGLSETTEVLKAVFEPRGHCVHRVRRTQLASDTHPRPHVVVWHADETGESTPRSRFAGVPQIVIGRTRVATSDSSTCKLSTLFQFRELLQAIESALQSSATCV